MLEKVVDSITCRCGYFHERHVMLYLDTTFSVASCQVKQFLLDSEPFNF
jgi:hypothetical protein